MQNLQKAIECLNLLKAAIATKNQAAYKEAYAKVIRTLPGTVRCGKFELDLSRGTIIIEKDDIAVEIREDGEFDVFELIQSKLLGKTVIAVDMHGKLFDPEDDEVACYTGAPFVLFANKELAIEYVLQIIDELIAELLQCSQSSPGQPSSK